MPDWKILITDGLEETGQSILSEAAQINDRTGISPQELLEEITGYDALIVRSRTQVSEAVFQSGRNLKVVGRAGVGVDNIDLAAAARANVAVVNAPQATSRAVAEHTLALILALARTIPTADAGMKSGKWLKKDLTGVEIDGKVLGLIGLGNIGGLVAQLAGGLGMQLLGYDPFLDQEQIRKRGARPASLEEIYSRSDFISLHVPLNRDTRGLINGQTLGFMKRGVRLICAARGGLIDEISLLDGLESGQVAGAALDVYSEEPPGLTALVTHPHVIATPHIAAQTVEAQARAARDIAEEVLACLRGQPLRWRVV
jgi:D-3-phosphoglycerate dehydrogenase